LEFIMNKISSVSSISSAAAREGQGSLRKSGDAGEQRSIDGGPSSKVALTGMALAMVEAQQIAEKTPDIDEQRVAEIRDAIASGSYNIDADRIASLLLKLDNDFVAD
jgi:negative regulator of flagellin synthesis FlgM